MHNIVKWWLSINWKTRSISILVLIISSIMSLITFVVSINMQNELIYLNLRFFRDFSMLVTYELISVMQQNNSVELTNFLEKIYLTTSTLDYVQLFNDQGSLILSFPKRSLVYQSMINVHIDIFNAKYSAFFLDVPIFINLIGANHSVTNCIIPLLYKNKVLGFLQLGLNFNSSFIFVNRFIKNASSFVFASVWLMFVLGTALNYYIIIDPVKELLIGMQRIALGKFGYNINHAFRGLLGDLIISFNAMSDRLYSYEKTHITQLTSEKAKLESLISTIADGAILLDTELRILSVNQMAVKVFQWSNQDLIGNIIFQHLPIHVNETLVPILNGMVKSNCLDNKNIRLQESIINLKYESLKTFRFLLSTIVSNDHQCFNGVVIIIQDITMQNQLNKAKNQFISNVSHELRTPLCNIGSFLETLIDYEYKLTLEQKKQFLDIAYAETQRLNSLVNDILDLSRLESECSYVLKPVILIKIIFDIVQASQLIALNKRVQIFIEVHTDIKKIYAHQSSICQVLSNLISNSLKFTHRQGRIVVRVYPLYNLKHKSIKHDFFSDVVRLEVIDEGVGIHKIFQKQIFDRFMRIENNIHILKGTGLGLSIVKNIIRKHNSIINVYSEVEVGTSFWFDLFISN